MSSSLVSYEDRSSKRGGNVLIGIIHVVVDGVNTTSGAAVAADRAARGGGCLGRSVGDGVSGGTAATLECMVTSALISISQSRSLTCGRSLQIHPVANLNGKIILVPSLRTKVEGLGLLTS